MISKRAYYWLTIIVMLFWLASLFIPVGSCEQKRLGPFGAFHWDVCDDFSFAGNVAKVIFEIITLAGTAYVIVLSTIYLKTE